MFSRNKFIWILLFFYTSIIITGQVRILSPSDYDPLNTNSYHPLPTRPSLDIYGIEMRKRADELNRQVINEYHEHEKFRRERAQQVKETNKDYNINYGLLRFQISWVQNITELFLIKCLL